MRKDRDGRGVFGWARVKAPPPPPPTFRSFLKARHSPTPASCPSSPHSLGFWRQILRKNGNAMQFLRIELLLLYSQLAGPRVIPIAEY